MASAIKDHTAEEKPNDLPPLLSKKFNITDVKQDALKWDKEWEAAIASDIEFIQEDLCSVQDNVAKILRNVFDEGHFDTIWLLLNAAEKKRHILEASRGHLQHASNLPNPWWGQASDVPTKRQISESTKRVFEVRNYR
ncbi:hypothetical protein BDR07DRAFT_1466619 [Suillus spraguei]|nr:hypothetical protein BDR07DRAFT_1466619 [Suillus spraguei]